MCKPKPGPRCSAHAREALISAHQAYAESIDVAQDGTEEHLNARQAAHQRWRAAREAYDATPDGLRALEHAVEVGQDPTAEDRLQAARDLRASQQEAFRSSQVYEERIAKALRSHRPGTVPRTRVDTAIAEAERTALILDKRSAEVLDLVERQAPREQIAAARTQVQIARIEAEEAERYRRDTLAMVGSGLNPHAVRHVYIPTCEDAGIVLDEDGHPTNVYRATAPEPGFRFGRTEKATAIREHAEDPTRTVAVFPSGVTSASSAVLITFD